MNTRNTTQPGDDSGDDWVTDIGDADLETFVRQLDETRSELSEGALDRVGQLVGAELQLVQLRRKVWRVAMAVSALAATVLLIVGFVIGRQFPARSTGERKQPTANQTEPERQIPDAPNADVNPIEDRFVVSFSIEPREHDGTDSLLPLDDYHSLFGEGY